MAVAEYKKRKRIKEDIVEANHWDFDNKTIEESIEILKEYEQLADDQGYDNPCFSVQYQGVYLQGGRDETDTEMKKRIQKYESNKKTRAKRKKEKEEKDKRYLDKLAKKYNMTLTPEEKT